MTARHFFSTLMLMIVSQLVLGQLCFPVKKVYAFFQPVTAGTMSREEAAKRQQKGNHLIYITSKSDSVKINNIWINGESHHAELLPVNTPVTLPAVKGMTIVPMSNRKTYQLIFTAISSKVSHALLPKKFASYPLVLEIQYRKKRKYFYVDSIKQLEVSPLY